ncbi:MAG: alpha/beta fold hydrolase [Dermatophilaceae bacterium]
MSAVRPGTGRVGYRRVSGSHAAGSVLLVPGRGDSLELREQTAEVLAGRGWSTIMVEHVGQGGSGHLGEHPDAVHIDDFAIHLRAAEHVVVSTQGTLHLLAHSMGGLIGAHLVARHPGRFVGAVFTAPMWRFGAGSPLPVVRAISTAMVAMGRGRRFAAGERPWTEESCLDMRTGDPDRREFLASLARQRRDLMRGGSTWGWTMAAARAMSDLGRLPLEAVTTRVTAVAAGDDATVSGRAIAKIVARFPTGQLLEVDGGHDILNGSPSVRTRFWHEVDRVFAAG